jgi:hypothetical protein
MPIHFYQPLNLIFDQDLPKGLTHARIAQIPAALLTALTEALTGKDVDVLYDIDRIRRSRFFAAYLYFYSDRLLDSHLRTARAIRKYLLWGALGTDAVDAARQIHRNPYDRQTAQGMECGTVDGADYLFEWGQPPGGEKRGTRHLREYVRLYHL